MHKRTLFLVMIALGVCSTGAILYGARASTHSVLFSSRLPPTPEIVEVGQVADQQTIMLAGLWLFVAAMAAMLTFDRQGQLEAQFHGEESDASDVEGFPLTFEPRFEKRKILVVEDDADFRDMIADALESRGHEVIRAESGAQALAIMKANHIDTVLADVVMPDGDGLALLDRIAARPKHPPVFLMTGTQVTESEARKRGAAGVLTKPFRRNDLIARLAV